LASVDEHIAQWNHNRKFLQDISPEFPDWIITAALYPSVHAVEALLTADGARQRSSHKDRLQILQSEKRYEKIYRSFRIVHDLAHVTRYSAQPSRWISESEIEQRIIRGHVYPIEASVKSLLAQARPVALIPKFTHIVLKTAAPR
jgi:hypothetical protein